MSTAAHAEPYGLVDVHAHFTTDSYIDQAKALGFSNPDGMPESFWPRWSAEEHLDLMGRVGVARSILSMSSPGVHLGDPEQTWKLAREVNLAAAQVKAAHPGQFGFFASLPLPSIDDSLAEIEVALDELHADGLVLMSNVAGRHLGARELAPVLEELDRRGAVVFLHPTSCTGHESLSDGRPQPMLEFLFDTARTIVDLVLSGAAARFRNLRLIVPHSGGVLPLLIDRVELFRTVGGEPADRATTSDLLARMYFDLAGTPSRRQLTALTGVVPASQLLYGSDYPWTRPELVLRALAMLQDAFPKTLGPLGVPLSHATPSDFSTPSEPDERLRQRASASAALTRDELMATA